MPRFSLRNREFLHRVVFASLHHPSTLTGKGTEYLILNGGHDLPNNTSFVLLYIHLHLQSSEPTSAVYISVNGI